MERAKGNFKNMGGARGVGNPVCPPEGPRSGRRSLWANVGLSTPLSAGGAKAPASPSGLEKVCVLRTEREGDGLQPAWMLDPLDNSDP